MNGPNQKERDYCKRGHDDDLIVRTLLSRELLNDKTIHTIDVDKDLFFNDTDVDLILVNRHYNLTTVEVKADGFPMLGGTKYVFLELISNSVKYSNTNGQEGLGCCLTSKSKYFIFYFIKYDKYLVIESKKLREFIKNNKDNYEHKQAKTWSPNNKKIWYYTDGIVVPVQDLVDGAAGIVKNSRYKYLDIKSELSL